MKSADKFVVGSVQSHFGFHTQEWSDLFTDYVVTEAGGELFGHGGLECFGRKVQTGVFPIGIDVDGFLAARDSTLGARTYDRMAASAGGW